MLRLATVALDGPSKFIWGSATEAVSNMSQPYE